MFPCQVQDILSVLDSCAADYSFPMLDNANIELAATRLGLFRSETDWAITIEVFGYPPGMGIPLLSIETFASTLIHRKGEADFGSPEAYAAYLQKLPCNESLFISHEEAGGWNEDEEAVQNAAPVRLRDNSIVMPVLADYATHGIVLENPGRVTEIEFCRWLAAEKRSDVLATPEEQRWHVPPDLVKILELDEWHHPDLVNDELPSQSETFQQLAQVLVHGDVSLYRPAALPNTHWSHWSVGGAL